MGKTGLCAVDPICIKVKSSRIPTIIQRIEFKSEISKGKYNLVKIVRRRYVAFQLKNSKFLPRRDLLTLLKEKEASGLGEKRSGGSYIRIIEYDPKRGTGIFRCDHKTVSVFRNSKKNFGDPDLDVIKISGSIKSLRRKTTT